MADKQLTELTALAVAPAASDVLYIGDLSEPVDDDKNKQITVDDLMKFLGSGNYTGSITLGSGQTLSVDVDADSTAYLGRCRFGSIVSDRADIGHYDQWTSEGVGFRQASWGDTTIGAPTGGYVYAAINNQIVATFAGSSVTLAQPLTVAADIDIETVLGKAKIGFVSGYPDEIKIAHYDQFASGAYALSQDASGGTILNAASGQILSLSVGGVSKLYFNTDTWLVGATFDLQTYTLDGSAATLHFNEAVAMTATSTELNQLDGVSVGGTGAGDIVTIDATQTLTSKTLTQPAIGDFTNATHDHSNAAGGGTLKQSVTIPVFDAGTAATTGEKGIMVVPPHLNGLDLTNVIVGVWDKGVTGSTDVGIYRSRGGTEVAMLSVEVTVGDEWYAQDGTINTANDDVATGDILNVNVSAVHSGTAPNGLTVTLEFS